MRRLFVRAPVFDPEGEFEKRQDSFYTWVAVERNGERIREKYQFGEDSYVTIGPGHDFDLSGNVKVLYPTEPNALVPKGLVVRLELLALLDLVDGNEARRDDAFFVLIDGSGAVDYNSIELVLDKLVREEYPIVLGRRPADSNWGMDDPDRKSIELFEKFLLERRHFDKIEKEFGGQLPDAQAGCWGLSLASLKHLGLTAHSYGLEFDVTASGLAATDLQIAFTDDLIMGQRIGGSGFNVDASKKPDSTTKFDTSIRKLAFIRHKLDYRKSEVAELYRAYRRDHELPLGYEIALEQFLDT